VIRNGTEFSRFLLYTRLSLTRSKDVRFIFSTCLLSLCVDPYTHTQIYKYIGILISYIVYLYIICIYILASIEVVYNMVLGSRKEKKGFRLSASTILLTAFNSLARVVKATLRLSSYPFLYICRYKTYSKCNS